MPQPLLHTGHGNALANGMNAYADEQENQKYQQLFTLYIGQLAQGGYADLHSLHNAIPAAACLGTMQYICSFADYVISDKRLQTDIAQNIRYALDDLLTLADFLFLQSQQHPLPYIQDYIATHYSQGI